MSDNASRTTLDQVLAPMRESDAATFSVMLKDPIAMGFFGVRGASGGDSIEAQPPIKLAAQQ